MTDKFNIVKKGYDPSAVDNYINDLEAVLKSYKDKDAAIKNAIINASIAADNMKSTAAAEASDIVNEARGTADNLRKQAYEQLGELKSILGKQKEAVKKFQSDFALVVSGFLEDSKKHDFQSVYNSIEEIEKLLDYPKQETKPAQNEVESDDDSYLARQQFFAQNQN
ncbi:hypothetical protein AGMMS49975_17870 [Clostridia bacterium]|nr:hypothetical protein AGMMS49975_17870 [Clostridia bacterium]